jgi:hypothetical protein
VRTAWTWLALAALACGSCQGFEDAPNCGTVPAGGCPNWRGGSCDDKACARIYGCTTRGWAVEEVCEREGGVDDAGADGESEADASMCGDSIAMPDGLTDNCDPNAMQLPDCPINAALGCPSAACLTGCSDFFVCRVDGWSAAAYCDEETGTLIWLDGY